MTTALPPVQASKAFPAALAAPAAVVATDLAKGELCAIRYNYCVCLDGETLAIPARVYYDRTRLLAATRADGVEGVISLCLGTRHHDGFVREHCLRRLLGLHHAWVAPFVVQLVGEYVVEIVQVIEAALPDLDASAYGRFLRENPRYLATTERRVISYWYAYREAGYRERGDEPGSRVIAAFRRMAAEPGAEAAA